MADNGSSFTMTAGEISGNQNYGVYDHWDGRFTISGASYIKDNTTSDVYLEQSSNAKAPNWNRKIKIACPLADDVKIGVRIYKNNGRDGLMPGIFTDGLPSNGSADNFFSSVDRYRVFSADNGEAELSEFSTITFDSNGGSEVEQQIVQNGKTVIRPEDPTLDHYTFVDWYQVLGNSAEDGSEVLSEIPFGFDGDDNAETGYGDITLVAVWGDAVECAAALQVWIFAALTRRALSLCRECSTDAAALRVWTLAALIRRICGMRAAWITCSKAALQVLKTPKKNEINVVLPAIMYDNAANEYETLPTLSKSIVLTREKPAVKGFSDVQDSKHAYYKAIYWAADTGITNGYPDGTFGINRNVSRGEAMMFLWRLRGKPAPKAASKSPFKDVPTNHVFYKAILWGSQKKITTGYTSGENKGKFMVNANCSRGRLKVFRHEYQHTPLIHPDSFFFYK